ncbi:hypothetical protein ACQ86N_15890 [Puia sp. P3]|uniref:hypothetical protein n=1 Tax=Puia sp. P3 TaxID=3423952 RepID=UPI003D67F5D6
MKKIITGWNLMRVLRLVMGVMAIGQAIANKEWILGLAGGFLLYPRGDQASQPAVTTNPGTIWK